jgi:hypothetical protein
MDSHQWAVKRDVITKLIVAIKEAGYLGTMKGRNKHLR